MKKILAILLTVLMAFTVVITANAADTDIAAIGEATYATLTAAITAADAGDTIKLLADVTENVTVGKSITIDGAGYKYTGNILTNKSSANIVIKNVNFVDYGDNYPVKSNGAKSITVENCTVSNCSWGLLYANKSTATITMKNVEINGGSYGLRISYNTTTTLENVTMKNVTYGVYTQTYGKRTFTLKDCTIAAATPFYAQNKGENVQTLNFKGANDLGIDVATLASDLVKVNLDVAMIGTETYATLKEAVEAAADGDTITIIADHALANTTMGAATSGMYNLISVEDKAVTIDLNGKKITADVALDSNMLAVFGTSNTGVLTLKDSSEAQTGTVDVTMADGTKAYSMFTSLGSSKMYIEGGNYSIDKIEAGQSMIYAGQDRQLFVSGGTFYLGNAHTKDPGNGAMQPWIYNAHGDGAKVVVVTGGTYNVDPTHYHGEAHFPDCYKPVEEATDKWTVKIVHTPGEEATCQAVQICTVCGEELDAVKDHTYGEYVSDGNATCEADGTKTAACIYGCGLTDTVADEGSMKPHTPGEQATCQAAQTCTVCGEELDAVKDHTYGEYVSDGNATCEADGTKTAACIYGCGLTDTITDEGSKGSHNDADNDGNCDGCDAEFCESCGKIHTDWMSLLFCAIVDFIKLLISFLSSVA